MGNNKKKGGGYFQNLAAKKFADVMVIDQYPEDEIYTILTDELHTILKQIANAKESGQYPDYAVNMFANISSARYIYEYVALWTEQIKKNGDSDLLSIQDVKSLRKLVADGFLKSRDKFATQQLEEKDRNKLLLKTYAMLDPKGVKQAMKLKFATKDKNKGKKAAKKAEKRNIAMATELALRMSKHPKYSIDRVAKLFDSSPVSNKKKLKVLKKLARTDARYVEYIGAALTLNRSITDFVSMAYDVVMKGENGKLEKKSKKKIMKHRLPYLRAYAQIFKKRRSYNTYLTEGFYQENKKAIKKLIREDLGFKKAFDVLKTSTGVKAKAPKTELGGFDKVKVKDQKKKLKAENGRAKHEVPRNADLGSFLDSIKPGKAV